MIKRTYEKSMFAKEHITGNLINKILEPRNKGLNREMIDLHDKSKLKVFKYKGKNYGYIYGYETVPELPVEFHEDMEYWLKEREHFMYFSSLVKNYINQALAHSNNNDDLKKLLPDFIINNYYYIPVFDIKAPKLTDKDVLDFKAKYAEVVEEIRRDTLIINILL